MKLHNETVSPRLIRCLKTIMQSDIFKDFNLVGGTCLSLQLGHRRSIDIVQHGKACQPNYRARHSLFKRECYHHHADKKRRGKRIQPEQTVGGRSRYRHYC